MPTYYKYVERNADSQVNWAEVGKNMSDMLIDQNRIRQEKKDAIDSATRKLGQEIADSPQGEHKEARTAALEFADDAAQYMRLQDKLLKSGELNFKDYSINRQNLSDGVGRAYGALKSYQEVAGKKMARWRNKESSLYELRKMEQGEKWGNWSKSNFYVNPTNGTVNVGLKTKKVIDGKEVYTMDSTPGEFASIGYVEGIINGYWDKLDVNKVADEFVKGLGKETRSVQNKIAELSKTGEITTISDITSRKDIDPETQQVLFQHINLENQTVDASLANPFDEGSILTDNGLINKKTGKPYDITPDETMAKNNPNLIYEKIDPSTGMGTLVFTKDQHKEAQNYVRNVIRGKYNYQEDIKITPQLDRNDPRPKTAAEIEFEQKKDDAKIFGQKMADVVSGKTADETQLGIDYFNTLPGVNASKEGNKVTIAYTDDQGNTDTQDFELLPSGGFKNAHDVGVTMAKLLNKQGLPEEAVAKSMDEVLKGRQGGTTFSAINKKSAVVDEDYTTKLGTYANEKLETAIDEDNPKTTVKNLTKDFGKLGYKFLGESRGLFNKDDYIQIQAPNGTLSEWIPVDNKENTNKISDFIKKNKNDEMLNKSGLFPTKKQQAAADKAKDCVNGKDKFGNPC